MLSDLKWTITDNADIGHVKDQLSEADRLSIRDWFVRQAAERSFDEMLDVFLWCCAEGGESADARSFLEKFDERAEQSGLSVTELSGLFFTHASLFEAPAEPDKTTRGRFIVFEGLDGSGKSTQIAKLAEKLKQLGRKVYSTAEPTNSATGGLIRDTLSNNYKRSATELAGLFLVDRISHNVNPVWGMKKFIDEGMDVVCDRYYYSSFAYQGLGTDMQWLMDMNIKCPEIMRPDLCIFLDVDHRKCKQRVDTERAYREIFEEDEDLIAATRKKFYEVFKLLNKTDNIRIIDANRPIDEVAEEIYRVLTTLNI